MRVCVHRLHGRMTEERLDDLRMLPPLEESRGECVAQTVEGKALIREPGVLE